MHGGPEMRKSGRDPSEETSPSLDLRISHGYKNRIREQLQNPFESFKSPALFHCTAYSILLHRKIQVLKQPPEGVLSDRFVSRFFQQISHRILRNNSSGFEEKLEERSKRDRKREREREERSRRAPPKENVERTTKEARNDDERSAAQHFLCTFFFPAEMAASPPTAISYFLS
jgi:hypothetical protein